MILVAKFLYYIFLIKILTEGTSLFPSSSLSIQEGNGFITYLKTSEEFGQLQNCSVFVSEVLFDLYQLEKQTHVYITGRFENLQRFSKSECGIRVRNVSSESAGDWIITATDKAGRIEHSVLKLTVSKPLVFEDVLNVSVTPGQSKRVDCPAGSATTTRRCRMIDIFGYSVESCSRMITWRQSERHFTCRSLVWGAMTETVNVINVYRKEDVSTAQKRIIETSEHIILECNTKTVPGHCVAESPDKEHLLLGEGWMSEHYSSFNTSLKDGRCTLELMKPLQDKDHGIWRIFFVRTQNAFHSGCVFNVGNIPIEKTPEMIHIIESAELPILIELETLSRQVISCEVPFEIASCYLQNPNHVIEYVNADELANFGPLGQCSFTVDVIPGEWICSINAIRGKTYHTHFQMKVYDKVQAVVKESVVVASVGDTVELFCVTVMDYTIRYCTFVAPNGHSYHLTDNTLPNSRIHYSGLGFHYGYCGIMIKNVKREDFGSWSCNYQLMENSKEQFLMMTIEQKSMSQAAVTGLSVGAALLIILATIYGGWRYKQRRTGNVPSVQFTNRTD